MKNNPIVWKKSRDRISGGSYNYHGTVGNLEIHITEDFDIVHGEEETTAENMNLEGNSDFHVEVHSPSYKCLGPFRGLEAAKQGAEEAYNKAK